MEDQRKTAHGGVSWLYRHQDHGGFRGEHHRYNGDGHGWGSARVRHTSDPSPEGAAEEESRGQGESKGSSKAVVGEEGSKAQGGHHGSRGGRKGHRGKKTAEEAKKTTEEAEKATEEGPSVPETIEEMEDRKRAKRIALEEALWAKEAEEAKKKKEAEKNPDPVVKKMLQAPVVKKKPANPKVKRSRCQRGQLGGWGWPRSI